jgi:fucose 4-O-acetylase-like acetyltransferase
VQKQRISWIDVARGIGIILVVYGHALSAHSLRYLIYSFHMPLFFFLSGLVTTYRPQDSPLIVLRKNILGLLFPYFLFAGLSFILWVITRSPSNAEMSKQFLSIFYGNGNNNLLVFNNILWFLPCLFLTRMGFYAVRSISGDRRFLFCALVAFSVIGYLYSLSLSDCKLFFGLETALTTIVFF